MRSGLVLRKSLVFLRRRDSKELVGCQIFVERTFEHSWNIFLISFMVRYNIREIRRHGEAGSVNVDDVVKERARIQEILKKFAPQDRFNADETGSFAFAPPDRGLATKQMSGEKKTSFASRLWSHEMPPVTRNSNCSSLANQNSHVASKRKGRRPTASITGTTRKLG
jgi:hypothetical protein